jgi:hypothetical protein
LTAYCVNGLVLYYSARLLLFIGRASQAGDLPSPLFAREFSPAGYAGGVKT